MFKFQVTGGSSGIGKAIAIECYRHGAFITLVARDEVSKRHAGRKKNLFFPFKQSNMCVKLAGEFYVGFIYFCTSDLATDCIVLSYIG